MAQGQRPGTKLSLWGSQESGGNASGLSKQKVVVSKTAMKLRPRQDIDI